MKTEIILPDEIKPEFPFYAESKIDDLLVVFYSEQFCTVINEYEGSKYAIGGMLEGQSCFNTADWRILPKGTVIKLTI